MLNNSIVTLLLFESSKLMFENGYVMNFKCQTNVSFIVVNKERPVYTTSPRETMTCSTSMKKDELWNLSKPIRHAGLSLMFT